MLESHGGVAGVLDEARLGSVLAAPQAEFAGSDHHVGVAAKAAAYMYHMIAGHPFVDGNKRTACTAMFHFLRLNGYDFVVEEREFEAMANAVATGSLSEEELVRWVAKGLTS
jgi:death-on-curing protein